MARHDFSDVKHYAYHESEGIEHDQPLARDEEHKGAGFIVYGIEVDGVRIPLGRVKAGKYFRNRDRAAKAKSES